MKKRVEACLMWSAVLLVITACSSAPQAPVPPQTPTHNLSSAPSTTLPTSPAITGTIASSSHQEADSPNNASSSAEGLSVSTTTFTNRSSATSSITIPTQSAPTHATPPPPVEPPRSLRFVEVAKEARNPIFLTATPGADHSYLAEQGGRILYLADDRIAEGPVLDVSPKVTFRGEQGLLGMAIHPTQPHRLFVHYSDRNGHTVVAEFSLSADGRTADPNSERLVFFTQQPATNHNGGMIQFGPDGYLYLGLGDGGRADDYYGHGQRPDTPLAALVRIDPDQATSEVWWYGLRNPWRFWIDQPTGLVYIADVGQNAYEEISVANLSEPNLNFGWPITEGLHCFEPRRDCDTAGLTLPVLEVPHTDRGTCSVTGGIVYRGPSMPGLWGHFFYSDYCGGYLRSFRWKGTLVDDRREWATDLGPVVSFGTDGLGEMYILTTDTVYRVMPSS